MSSRHQFREGGLKAAVDSLLDVVTVPLAATALIATARSRSDELAWPVHCFVAAFVLAAAATVYLMLRPLTIAQEEDDKGNVGTNLNKDLKTIARNALKDLLLALSPIALARKVLREFKPYITEFRAAFGNFCIHAGGRAVIDMLQRSLNLSDEQVKMLKMALHRFENTLSSSLCYKLIAYIEAKGNLRRGDQVWMIGLGSIQPTANPEGPRVTPIHSHRVDINHYYLHSKL